MVVSRSFQDASGVRWCVQQWVAGRTGESTPPFDFYLLAFVVGTLLTYAALLPYLDPAEPVDVVEVDRRLCLVGSKSGAIGELGGRRRTSVELDVSLAQQRDGPDDEAGILTIVDEPHRLEKVSNILNQSRIRAALGQEDAPLAPSVLRTRLRQAEQFLQIQLARRGIEQVGAAHDIGDALQVVVDHVPWSVHTR